MHLVRALSQQFKLGQHQAGGGAGAGGLGHEAEPQHGHIKGQKGQGLDHHNRLPCGV